MADWARHGLRLDTVWGRLNRFLPGCPGSCSVGYTGCGYVARICRYAPFFREKYSEEGENGYENRLFMEKYVATYQRKDA